MMPVKATPPFERYLNKNLGRSLMDQKVFYFGWDNFAVVALFHLVRIYMDWPVMIGDWSVPMLVSWIGFVVAGGLDLTLPSGLAKAVTPTTAFISMPWESRCARSFNAATAASFNLSVDALPFGP
jgi:hypothetical protein